MTIYLNKHLSYNTKNKSILYKQKQTHVYSDIHVMLKVYSRNNQCYSFYCKENTNIVVKTDFHKQSIAKPEAIPMKSVFPMHTVL